MKVAVANDQGFVSPHFGRCEIFSVFETEGDRLTGRQDVPNTGHGHGHLPRVFLDQRIDIVISGGMGENAQAKLSLERIRVLTGVEGRVEEVMEKFLKGELSSTDVSCGHDHLRQISGGNPDCCGGRNCK